MWESYMRRSVEEEKDDRGVHGDRMAADDEPVWEHDPRAGYDSGEQAAKHLSMMPDELRDMFQVGTEEIMGKTHYHIEPAQDLDQYPDGEGSDMGHTEKIINGFQVGLADGMYPVEIRAIQQENNLNQPIGDEHNPGEPSNVNTSAMYRAMDKAQDLEHIASKYQDMTDAQLQAHAEVIDALIEAGEEYRTRYFDGEAGAPF